MSVIDQLVEEFERLPGVGSRTALRLVHHLMKRPPDEARRLAASIREVADRVRPCSTCGNFAEGDLCAICMNTARDRSTICVVEEAFEVGAVERTGAYRGVYHVLGGHLSPLDGIGPDELAVAALERRVAEGGVDEMILATSSGVEGQATAVWLEGLFRPRGIRVTRPARGLPMGSDLEYVDGSTLSEALAARKEM
ncbi:MAG: recombination mediator RecR [Longimicrobiales bacterium]|nr:recombination mediator RecR [Longimicrobiales bacterium]